MLRFHSSHSHKTVVIVVCFSFFYALLNVDSGKDVVAFPPRAIAFVIRSTRSSSWQDVSSRSSSSSSFVPSWFHGKSQTTITSNIFLEMKPVSRSQRRRPPPSDADDDILDGDDNATTSDPWAGYRSTDDDDDDDEKRSKDTIVDDVNWLSKLGLPKQVIENMPPKESSSTTTANLLPRDDFFQPFDDDQFQKIQRDYQQSKGIVVESTINGNINNSIDATATTLTPTSTSNDHDDSVAMTNEYLQTATYPKPKSSPFATVSDHNQYQQDYFNNQTLQLGNTRRRTYAKSQIPLIKHMAKRFISQLKKSIHEGIDQRNVWNIPNRNKESYPTTLTILDVGCGMAEYWTFLLEAANEQRVTLEICGMDVSEEAVQFVNTNQAEVALDEQGGRHVLQAQQQDVFDIFSSVTVNDNDSSSSNDKRLYHAVLLHNTWCHLWNTTHFLDDVVDRLLVPDGILFVADTEYGGNDGSRRNNQENPTLFPNVLPSIVDMRRVLRTLPLMILDANERIDLISGSGKQNTIVTYDWYSITLVRTLHRALPEIARFRGVVVNGFGRGSKKLGFPTANLGPHEVFQSALEHLTTMATMSSSSSSSTTPPRGGVYFGWAVLEDPTGRKKGRNTYHRAVVNVGFSPTFVGMENVQRTIEAYLILEDQDATESINSDLTRMVPSDFYQETVRLQLHGYLRPEQKFDSLASLITQISLDVEHTKNALRLQPFAALRSDVFLVDPCRRINNTLTSGQGEAWIGSAGGNATASWEFQDITSALQATPLGQWVV